MVSLTKGKEWMKRQTAKEVYILSCLCQGICFSAPKTSSYFGRRLILIVHLLLTPTAVLSLEFYLSQWVSLSSSIKLEMNLLQRTHIKIKMNYHLQCNPHKTIYTKQVTYVLYFLHIDKKVLHLEFSKKNENKYKFCNIAGNIIWLETNSSYRFCIWKHYNMTGQEWMSITRHLYCAHDD